MTGDGTCLLCQGLLRHQNEGIGRLSRHLRAQHACELMCTDGSHFSSSRAPEEEDYCEGGRVDDLVETSAKLNLGICERRRKKQVEKQSWKRRLSSTCVAKVTTHPERWHKATQAEHGTGETATVGSLAAKDEWSRSGWNTPTNCASLRPPRRRRRFFASSHFLETAKVVRFCSRRACSTSQQPAAVRR